MEYTKSKSHKRDVTEFVEWMKSELRSKASQKSEVYSFDFLSDSSPERSCKRLSWVKLTRELPTDDSSIQNPLPQMRVLNS
jgi:hypothetical protein